MFFSCSKRKLIICIENRVIVIFQTNFLFFLSCFVSTEELTYPQNATHSHSQYLSSIYLKFIDFLIKFIFAFISIFLLFITAADALPFYSNKQLSLIDWAFSYFNASHTHTHKQCKHNAKCTDIDWQQLRETTFADSTR